MFAAISNLDFCDGFVILSSYLQLSENKMDLIKRFIHENVDFLDEKVIKGTTLNP